MDSKMVTGLMLAIGFLAIVNGQNAKPCEFTKKCQCVKESERIYSEISCLNVTKGFPKFELNRRDVTVKKLVISGAIEEMPQTGLDKFARIEHLVIEFTNGPASFRVEDKGKSTLANCSIDRMSLIGFRKLPPLTKSPRAIDEKTLASLSILSIEKSDIDLDGEEAFKGASTLKALRLRNNGMTDTTIADEVRPFKAVVDTLTELDLGNNAIQAYSYWKVALEDLINLQTLILNRNILQDLKGADFSKFQKLQTLDLSNNLLLSSFDDSVIPTTHPSLVELNLDNCKLTDFPTGALQNVGALEKLRLGNNKIEKLTPLGFSKVPLLHTLTLDGNPVLQIEPGTFQNLVALKNFSVKNWDLDVLDLSVFGSGLENLQVNNNGRLHILKISDNSSIPVNLGNMQVSGNNLSIIDQSIEQLLQKEVYFTMTVSNEHYFECPYEESIEPVTGLPLILVVIPNNDTDQFANGTLSNETTTTILPTTTTPFHPNASHSLMWLARIVVCTQRIHLANNVFCAQGDGDTNKTRVYDFLASMNPDCTGLTGTSTTPASTPKGRRTGGAASDRLFNSALPWILGLLILVIMK